jgi:hypothetical protein
MLGLQELHRTALLNQTQHPHLHCIIKPNILMQTQIGGGGSPRQTNRRRDRATMEANESEQGAQHGAGVGQPDGGGMMGAWWPEDVREVVPRRSWREVAGAVAEDGTGGQSRRGTVAQLGTGGGRCDRV